MKLITTNFFRWCNIYMKILNKKIHITTNNKTQMINITGEIQQIIDNENINEGLINIQTKHTTTAIIINEDEEGLKDDFIKFINDIIPESEYKHDRIDNNAKSHLQSMILNSNQTIPLINGELNLGRWQSIFFIELDGPRMNRVVEITILTKD